MGRKKERKKKRGGKGKKMSASVLANFLSTPPHSSLLPIRDNGSFLRIVYYIFQTGHDELRAPTRNTRIVYLAKRITARRYILEKLLFYTSGNYWNFYFRFASGVKLCGEKGKFWFGKFSDRENNDR